MVRGDSATVDWLVPRWYHDAMVKEYRPRIKPDIAERIAGRAVEQGESFEAFVNRVLRRYLEQSDYQADAQDMAFQASRQGMFAWTDPKGADGQFDKLPLGGWGEGPKDPDVMAGLVLADEGYGAEPIGVALTANDLRGLRDAITDVLNDGPWNARQDA